MKDKEKAKYLKNDGFVSAILTKDKDGVVHRYYMNSKKRFFIKLMRLKFYQIALKVVYRNGYINKTAWFDNKKDLIQAFKSFTDKDLIKEFLHD